MSIQSLERLWMDIGVWNDTSVKQISCFMTGNTSSLQAHIARNHVDIYCKHCKSLNIDLHPHALLCNPSESSMKSVQHYMGYHWNHFHIIIRTSYPCALLRSDLAQAVETQKQHKCLHEHWKNCQDYPEAHTWESRAEEDIKDEKAVCALIAAEDDSYLAYEEACRVRQLVSNMITRGNTPDAGRKVITGRMKVT
ncbi:hypothetical protein EI94DRAFT_1708279 [Lactarius quietus]|nr:hypothetical protein EI94DRAFT_1708279 [Lactarius quietus]